VWAANAAMLNPMSAIGDIILGGAAGAPTRLAAVAAGQVLASAGVNAAPVWSATPTLTTLTLFPPAVSDALIISKPAGQNVSQIKGQTAGVNRWALVLGDTSSETGSNAGSDFVIASYSDAGQYLATILRIRRADSAVILSGSLLANSLQMATGQWSVSYTSGDTYLTLQATTGGHNYQFLASGTGSGLGAGSFTLWDYTMGQTRLSWSAAGDFNLGVSGLQARQVSTGAPDSGGPGFRTLRIAN
jgi:hypothetical protein